MISHLDTNKDGKVSYNEFERFMKEGDICMVLDDETATMADSKLAA